MKRLLSLALISAAVIGASAALACEKHHRPSHLSGAQLQSNATLPAASADPSSASQQPNGVSSAKGSRK